MALSSGINQFSGVKPFDGSGYANWEFRVSLILEQNSVLYVTKQDPPAEADARYARLLEVQALLSWLFSRGLHQTCGSGKRRTD